MAVDFFLKLDSIQGESVDDNHKDQISVTSFSWGGSQTTSVAGSGGSGAGKVNLIDLSIMKYLDKATPKLFQAMCKGTHVATGTLYGVKSGADGKPFLQIDFKELFITSIQTSGSSEVPMESVSFSYNEIKIEYFQQDDKGTLTSTGAITYDLKANKNS
jgi:type VI secretion system secreted protein Hcp